MASSGSGPAVPGAPALRVPASGSGGVGKLSGAASKSYSVASAWERSAKLSDQQLRVVDAIAAAVGQRPMPAHLPDDDAPDTAAAAEAAGAAAAAAGGLAAAAAAAAAAGTGTGTTAAAAAAAAAAGADRYVGPLEEAVLHNAKQFHLWHAELEAACAREAEQKYGRHADLLRGHLASCAALQGRVAGTLGALDALLSLHADVAASSQQLSGSTEALLREKAALQDFADALRSRLRVFDEYEAAAGAFAAAAAAPEAAEQLAPLLDRLDECVAYVAANPQYADAAQYANKFRALHARALGLAKARVQGVLRGAAAAVAAAVADAAAAAANGGGEAGGQQQQQQQALQGGPGGGAASLLLAGRAGSGRTASGALLLGAGGRAASGALGGGGGAAAALPEGLEVSLLYVRFRAAAEPQLKELVAALQAKAAAGRPEYARLLEDCRAVYSGVRLQLVEPQLAARLAALAGLPLPQLVRAGAEQLLRVGQLEGQLLEQLFGAAAGAPPQAQQQQFQQQQQQQQRGGYYSSTAAAAAASSGSSSAPHHPLAEALRPLLEPLGQLLYDHLRPRFVQLADIDALAELVAVLQDEVLLDQLPRRGGPAGEALAPSLAHALADLQERLIFRAQAFIKDGVERYAPRPGELEYPARLEAAAAKAAAARAKEQQQAAAAVEEAGAGAGAAGPAGSSGGAAGIGGEITSAPAAAADGDEPTAAAAGEAGADGADGADNDDGDGASSTLYTPVAGTLLLLAKLHRCIDRRAFSGLAQEAVAACTASVQAAGRAVARASTPADAQLFVIAHLLHLREQIAQFDVDLTATDVDLDFTHMRDHMRRIVSGEASLFTLSGSNAVVQMLGRSGPRVVAAAIDTKRDLEQQLKACCEGFIMGVTKGAVEPLLGFTTKVTAVRLAAGSNPALAKPLREQAFGAPAKLAELVAAVNGEMAARLPAAAAKARLYLPNAATRAILFRPVRANIAEAHAQVAQLLKGEYTAEEAAAVPLLPPERLEALLNELA